MSDQINLEAWVAATRQYGDFVQHFTVLQINAQSLKSSREMAEQLKLQLERTQEELKTCEPNIRDSVQNSVDSFRDLYQKAQTRYEKDKATVTTTAQNLQRSIAQYRTTAPSDLVQGLNDNLQGIEKYCQLTIDTT